MKSILTIILIVITLNATAQFTPHPAGSYVLHPELDKFTGTWKWNSGLDTVIIFVKKEKIHYPDPLDYDEDRLVGWHKYVKNGTLIESSIQYAGSPFIGGHSTIFAWNHVGNPIKLYGSFSDLSKNKGCDIYLTMTNSAYTQITWLLRNPRGINPDGFQYGFTLPVNLVLTKQ